MKVYLSGQVTGIDYPRACASFYEAEKTIALRGDQPVTPVRLCNPDKTWAACMRICIKALMDCDGIYMLKGWRKSRGARLEHFIALKLGMRVEVEK